MRLAICVAALAAFLTAPAASDTEIEIQPGPVQMSEAEKAIVADPANGIQHGVILLEETNRDDDYGGSVQIAYHLRAKILSNEARSLGDVAIHVDRGAQDVKKWWGRTICPDRTQELPESGLAAQMMEKTSMGTEQELRGALPGVGPGCVIDYGYVLHSEYISRSRRVFLQGDWPVQLVRYRWVPSRDLPASYVLSRANGLPIHAESNNKSVLVTASNMAPVPKEPHAPPPDESRASVIFYYTDSNANAQDYWDSAAKSVERRLRSFVSGNDIRELVSTLPVPKDAPIEDRLRAAYTWIDKNLKNTSLRSAEEAEAVVEQDEERTFSANAVLKARQGSPRQLDYIFAGMARALGAEANIVFAVDRTEGFWMSPLKSMDQFAYTLVAVRSPGQPNDKLTFVDAGSGLEYGQIPWRAVGATALMCGPKGSTDIVIPVDSPKTNRSDTHVALTFSEGNDSVTAKWDTTAAGALGSDRRRWLRHLAPRERKQMLERMCGTQSSDVTAADVPGIEDRAAPYKLVCEFEQSDINIHKSTGTYGYRLLGPWWPETPEFSSPTRTQPVMFDYPKVDILAIDITSPHGFKPKAAPAPIQIQSPFGRYGLQVTATATGYHVDRAFALTVLNAKKEEYADLRKFLQDVHDADQVSVLFDRAGSRP